MIRRSGRQAAAKNAEIEERLWRLWLDRLVKTGGREWEGERKDIPPAARHMTSPRPGLPGCKVPAKLLNEYAPQLAALGVRAA
jgi:hypothetical protein